MTVERLVHCWTAFLAALGNEWLPRVGICIQQDFQHGACPASPTSAEIMYWHGVTAALLLVSAIHFAAWLRSWTDVDGLRHGAP